MRSYEREPDLGGLGASTPDVPVEWEYVRTRRRPGAPDGSLPIRLLLVDEGIRTVDRRGPNALSVTACARAIGVSKGAPYSWFADAGDFRAAVAAGLLTSLTGELSVRARFDDESADHVSLLAADVGTVVRDWAANGMGIDQVLTAGGPASRTELWWEAERFVRHFTAAVHAATRCGCSERRGLCRNRRPLVDAVLALCHGYAALARVSADPVAAADEVGRAAERAVPLLVPGAGTGTEADPVDRA